MPWRSSAAATALRSWVRSPTRTSPPTCRAWTWGSSRSERAIHTSRGSIPTRSTSTWPPGGRCSPRRSWTWPPRRRTCCSRPATPTGSRRSTACSRPRPIPGDAARWRDRTTGVRSASAWWPRSNGGSPPREPEGPHMSRPASRRAEPAKQPRGFTLTTPWVAVLLALLTLVFFHDVSLEGRTFVSPDATAPAGFVRIGEQSLWKDHVYPLWNPFVFLGMPSYGSGGYNPLIYPPDWPVALLQKVLPLPELTWLLLYYFLAGLFTYLLAREWGARPEGALIAAAAFVFQPNLVAVGAHGHGRQLVDSASLPRMVWLAARWLRKGTLGELGWLALAGGFQFLRGHVQICFYTWIAIGLYVVVKLSLAARQPEELVKLAIRSACILGAAALAFGIAGIYNLPLRDYARYSMRASTASGGAPFEYATSWSMALYELPSIVFPNFVGFGGATYWGGMPFTDYPNGYVGVIVILLALCGFAASGGGDLAARIFAGALALFALLVGLGKHFPLYGFLYDHLPMFNKFRIPVMILVLFQLGLALAAAWGWGLLVRVGEARGRFDLVDKLLAGSAAALGALGLFALFGAESARGGYVTMALAH